MIAGIDASNLRAGGGRTHLIELLAHGDGNLGAFDRVVVWGSRETLALLPDRRWIARVHEPMLDQRLAARLWWQQIMLPRRARDVDVVFAPGGLARRTARPTVVMSRNLLPFEDDVRARYGGRLRLKLEVLRHAQARSFTTADGVIFLTDHARQTVCASLPRPPRRVATVPHGVSERFFQDRHPGDRALRLLYVSTVSLYKHQGELVDAVEIVRRELPVELVLVGPDDGTGAADTLRARIAQVDPNREYLRYEGSVPFERVHELYAGCDVFVFASACENMPNALLEAMASGAAIACSQAGPMPEILGDAGVYFDPTSPLHIAREIRRLAGDPALRARLGTRARERAAAFTWERCARDTFGFLGEVASA
jgi:glycosyltransferase involved in cell wall biosynthesis